MVIKLTTLDKIDKAVRAFTKILERGLLVVMLIITGAIIYVATVYPQNIINKTKLGMSKQDIETVYADNHYYYTNTLIKCMIGCKENILITRSSSENITTNTENTESIENTANIKEYMVVSTGIDGVFIIGFDENDTVVFATSGDT